MNAPLPVSLYLRAALRKIRFQFSDTPEGRCMFAIVEQSIMDLIAEKEADRESAIRYLNGNIFHAQLAGVRPEWIREVLKFSGVHFAKQYEVLA